MLCQLCNKNTATIHIKEFINGQQKSLNICAECAAVNSQDNDLFSGFNIAELFMDINKKNKLINENSYNSPEIIPLGEEQLRQINDFANNLLNQSLEANSIANENAVEKQNSSEVDEIMAILDDIECNNCHWKLSKFKLHGQLGCSDCYNNFRKVINESLNELHFCNEHLGKIPNSGENIIDVGQITMQEHNMILKYIANLQSKMNKYVRLEDYEAAAVIRDEIKKLEKKINIVA